MATKKVAAKTAVKAVKKEVKEVKKKVTKKVLVEKKPEGVMGLMEQLLESGAHFGHTVKRWNPKMKRFVWQERGGVHIFDLEKTAKQLELAEQKLREFAAVGKRMVMVGTKRQARDAVLEAAQRIGIARVTERWLGGTITNWGQIKSRLNRLAKLKDDRDTGKLSKYVKKERVLFDKEIEKLERFFGGISSLKDFPEVAIIVDTHKEKVAVREAKARGVFVIGVVDTNADPDLVDLPIPMNDDSIAAIKLVVDRLALAIEEGKKAEKKEIKK